MINNVTLVGRLTKDPELKFIGDNVPVCNFTIAVERPYRDKDGEKQADFIQCQTWKGSAEFMAKYLSKGNLIGVTGSIATRSYDKENGDRVYITEINCNTVQGLESKKQDDAKPNYKSVDEAKRAWTSEWEIKSVGLDKAAKDNLKNTLAKKYQPIIDELDNDKPY